MKKKTTALLLALIIFEIAFVGYLLYVSPGNGETDVCIIGEGSSCQNVQNSVYGSIAGMKVSQIGLVSFIILLIVFIFWKDKKIFLICTLLGALTALYFIIIQLFVLKTICSECMVIDLIAILIFLIALFSFRKQRRWSIGMILASQASKPGSTPGRRIFIY